MKKKIRLNFPDPMESGFIDICNDHNIEAIPYDTVNGIDFYLPKLDCYVELKQFHSNRIAEQSSRVKNIIVIQGIGALHAFRNMLDAQPS